MAPFVATADFKSFPPIAKIRVLTVLSHCFTKDSIYFHVVCHPVVQFSCISFSLTLHRKKMKIDIAIGDGLKVDALCGSHTIRTDQPVKSGGEASAPDPFTCFLGSLGTCAGYFIARFCQSRNISTEDIQIQISNDFNETLHIAENIAIAIALPASFPEKYRSALLRAVDQCTVKKTILHRPNIEVLAR